MKSKNYTIMKKLLPLIFGLLMALPGSATEFVVSKLKFATISNGEVECLGFGDGYGPNIYNITIPGFVTYGGTEYKVNRIAYSAFEDNTTLIGVRLDWGITRVMNLAFAGCTSLQRVNLPSTITTIDNLAFDDCESMTTFTCAAATAPTTASNAFQGMKKCNIYTIPRGNGDVPADDYNRYTVWVNADSDGEVTADGTLAYDFEQSGRYYAIHTARSVSSYSAKATLVGVNSTVTYIPISNVQNYTPVNFGGCSSPYVAKLTYIANDACRSNISITSVGRDDLGDNTEFEAVGASAFQNCTALTSVSIPCGKIHNDAFKNCTALASLKLYGSTESAGVNMIGPCSFENTGLTSVYIPSSVRYIESWAFASCKSLKTISVSNNNAYFVANRYGHLYTAGYKALKQVGGANDDNYIDSRCIAIADGAFEGNTVITEVDIPYGVTSLGQCIIRKSSIESLKVPSSVTGCAKNAFIAMDNLKVLYINLSSPSSIGSPYITTGSNAVLCVPKGAIPNWKANSELNGKFSGGIYEGAYDLSSELLSQSKGEYYTVISNAPYTDTNVQANEAKGKLRLVAGKHAWPGSGIVHTLNNNSYDETIRDTFDGYIVTEIERDLYKGDPYIRYVDGGLGVKKIGAQAFAGSSVYSVYLKNLEVIGDSAFFNCKTMAGSYKFTGSLLSVGEKAFYGCTGVTELIFPRSGLNQYTLLMNDAFGNNAANFKCYVPMRNFDAIADGVRYWPYTGSTAQAKVQPMVKASAQWLTLTTCNQPVTLPSTASFYAVTDFDSQVRKVSTAVVTGNVPAGTPLLMNVEADKVDSYIKFSTASTGKAVANNLLLPGTTAGVSLRTDSYYSDYLLNADNNRFERVKAATTVYNDVAYLPIDGQAPSRVNQYQIDKIYYRGFKYGDFWYDYRDGAEDGLELAVIAPQRGDSYRWSTMEIPASFTYNDLKRTVREIDSGAFTGQLVDNVTLPASVDIIRADAFKDATRLKKLIITFPYNPRLGIIENGFASGNDANFKCYVPNTFLDWYNTNITGITICPWIKINQSNYQPFSCAATIQLPDGIKSYTVTGYNNATRVVTTKELTSKIIPSHNGVLLKGYKSESLVLINRATGDLSLGTNYLKSYVQASESPLEQPNQVPYYFNHDNKYFSNDVFDVRMGESYLSIPVSIAGSDWSSPVYIDLEYTSPFLTGDVNGDGNVNAGDVSAIYGVILGTETDTAVIERANINGDSVVNAGDISSLYEIILAK